MNHWQIIPTLHNTRRILSFVCILSLHSRIYLPHRYSLALLWWESLQRPLWHLYRIIVVFSMKIWHLDEISNSVDYYEFTGTSLSNLLQSVSDEMPSSSLVIHSSNSLPQLASGSFEQCSVSNDCSRTSSLLQLWTRARWVFALFSNFHRRSHIFV